MLSKSQLADRMKGIGGSDVGIILGLSTYKTPYELYLEKKGLLIPAQKMTPQQEWGHRLEPIIREKFQENNDVKIIEPETTIHPFYEFMRANVDGFIPSTNMVFEAKSSGAFMAKDWGDDGSDIIPMSYLTQVAHYVSVFNADGANIALLLGGNDYREFIYKRDYTLEQTIIDACNTFWGWVQNNIEPNPINIDDLKLKYAKEDVTKLITANAELELLIPSFADIKRQQKELKVMETEHKYKIMEYMKDATCLIDCNGEPLVTLKATKKGNRTLLLKGSKS